MTSFRTTLPQLAVSESAKQMRAGLLLICVLSLVACGEANETAGSGTLDKPSGEQTYIRYCFSCHASGVAGAPKVGDVEAWAPRAEKGLSALVATSMEGVPPGMPAQGLCNSCTEQEMEDAIQYMIDHSQGE